MKTLLLLLITGSVLTQTSEPVANAVVSDGYSVVKTDNNGLYAIPYTDAADYVFVSVPSGYDFPVDSTGTATIWQRIDTTQTSQYNFTLRRQPDGGKADSSHVLLAFGDPQVLDSFCLWRFQNETMADIKQLTASYPAGTRFIGITVGDIVWDEYEYFETQKKLYSTLDFPNFFVIGNHDHCRTEPKQPTEAEQDSVASKRYEAVFGPTYYSFNVGAVHYVVLDNVLYTGYQGGDKGYNHGLTDKQRNWVKQDIAQLDSGTQVVFAMHMPGSSMTKTPNDYQMLRKLVSPLNSTCYLLTGHSHTNTIDVPYSNFIEHNVAAVQGSFWCSDWCSDGSPNGYKVFETNATGICNWYYKGTGLDKDFRITTFPTNSINAGNTKQDKVLANIWDYDPKCSVKILENGKEYDMYQFTGTDPDLYDIMKDEADDRPNYPSGSKNPGSTPTGHLFYYTPKVADATYEVVFTDRFNKTTSASILRHMMVADFKQAGEYWEYKQDFSSLPSYPNTVKDGIGRGTWIAGHTPKGWYAATSNMSDPASLAANWGGYNYLYIDNGSKNNAGLYAYEHSLGSLNTNLMNRICYGVLLENNTGGVITSIDLTYTSKVWRTGSDEAREKDSLHVSYAVLTDEEALAIRDRKKWIGQIETTPIHQFTFDVEVQPGQVIMLRWDDDLVTKDNTDQALSIDDVLIKATSVEPSALQPATSNLQPANSANHVVIYKGEVLIQTEHNTYTLTGSPL